MRIRMMVRDIITTQIVVAFLLLLGTTTIQGAGVEDSVVKIIAGEHSGTGFVWQGKYRKYIATSLHTVAGATEIYYNKTLSRYELEVYKIDKESDLALLRPKTGEINQPALKLGNIEPVEGRKYWIYGFPAGVLKVQGDSLEFSKAEHNIPMTEYLANEVVKKVTASGFPQASLKLLRVSSGITPGHSGAPIIDPSDNNAVIGIGAGGLSNVGFRRVNWAVPALTYLPRLETEGAQESTTSMSVSEDERKFSVRTEQAAPPLETKKLKYYNVGQVPLGDLLESLVQDGVAPEDQWFDQDALNYVKREAKKSNFDLKAPIDIYQNVQTGAMVYIPAVIPRESITMGDDNMLVVDAGRTRMYLQIIKEHSYHDASLRINGFLTFLDRKHGVNKWLVDSGSRWNYDEPVHYPKRGYWENETIKYKPGPHYRLSEADISFRINYDDKQKYGNFLGVAIMGLDYENWIDGPDDEMYFLLDSCAWVAGFVPN